MDKYRLNAIVFLGGFAVMGLELVGSRIVAPFLGTSTFVWTSLIGVILGSLSFGYWLGGKYADKSPGFNLLAKVLFFAGILVGITAAANLVVLGPISVSSMDVRAGSLIAALFLFAPASVLFGMVSPLAAKISLQDLANSGATVGGLYALSTLGSILGTFLYGFFIISYIGSIAALASLSAVTFIAAALASPGMILKRSAHIVLIFFAIFSVKFLMGKDTAIKDFDTGYYRVLVRDVPAAGRPMRYLITSADTLQSVMYPDDPDALASQYTKFYDLHEALLKNRGKALMLGGGAYSYPKYFLKRNPQSTLDVVELDPGLTETAKKYFGLKENARLKIYHKDARVFLNRTNEKYDVLFIDVFTSLYSIPHHMITREAVLRENELLSGGGAVFVNVISAVEGDKAELLGAIYNTYSSVFPQVYVFPVNYPDNPVKVQNVMLVALKSDIKPDWPALEKSVSAVYVKNLRKEYIPGDEPVFTDDFAPVEKYVARML